MEWVVIGVTIAIVVFVVQIFNNLVRMRNVVREGWSGIDVQLRHARITDGSRATERVGEGELVSGGCGGPPLQSGSDLRSTNGCDYPNQTEYHE